MEETFETIQKIVSEKGYVDANALNRLTKRMNKQPQDTCDKPQPSTSRVLKPENKPKRNAGGGDREGKIKASSIRKDITYTHGDLGNSPSEVTIYRKAVKDKKKESDKRFSSSSEEMEIDAVDYDGVQTGCHSDDNLSMAHSFIAEMRRSYEENRHGRNKSRGCTPERFDRYKPESRKRDDSPMDRVEHMIRNAEANRMKIFNTPGKQLPLDLNREFVHSAMVDKTYMLVASHLEESVIRKIENAEYVDFSKLIPKDKILAEEETELKLIMKEGRTFYVPVKEATSISNFNHWEQAFRVYSNIYLRKNPDRATELIQYNHVIHSASLIYIWSNVYAYDQDFRIHMSRHPGRSWATLLQQSWSIRLQEKLRGSDTFQSFGGKHSKRGSFGGNKSASNSEPCRKFNRRKYTFGPNCKFEHRCSYCFKFSHAAVNCRKAMQDMQDN